MASVYSVATRKLKPVVMPISGALTTSSSNSWALEEAHPRCSDDEEISSKDDPFQRKSPSALAVPSTAITYSAPSGGAAPVSGF